MTMRWRRYWRSKVGWMVEIEVKVIVEQIRSLNGSVSELEQTIANDGGKQEGHGDLTSIEGDRPTDRSLSNAEEQLGLRGLSEFRAGRAAGDKGVKRPSFGDPPPGIKASCPRLRTCRCRLNRRTVLAGKGSLHRARPASGYPGARPGPLRAILPAPGQRRVAQPGTRCRPKSLPQPRRKPKRKSDRSRQDIKGVQ